MRVIGNINGSRIEFTQTGKRWEVIFPASADGEYVAEISAVDDAGNRGYLCTMLFAINGHTVRGYVVSRGFSGTAEMCEYQNIPRMEGFFAQLTAAGYTGGPNNVTYSQKIIERGYALERVIHC